MTKPQDKAGKSDSVPNAPPFSRSLPSRSGAGIQLKSREMGSPPGRGDNISVLPRFADPHAYGWGAGDVQVTKWQLNPPTGKNSSNRMQNCFARVLAPDNRMTFSGQQGIGGGHHKKGQQRAKQETTNDNPTDHLAGIPSRRWWPAPCPRPGAVGRRWTSRGDKPGCTARGKGRDKNSSNYCSGI